MLPALLLTFVQSSGLAVGDQSPPETVAEPIRVLLDSRAIEWSDGEKKRMTLWMRKELPAKASAEQIKNGLTARELVETAIIGVVTLHESWIDYRKQDITPGTYTLRLAFQPDTGDHKETAPHTEFLLLTPVADDRSTDEIEVKTLVERSRKATGGDHPAVMLIVPVHGPVEKPTLKTIGKAGAAIAQSRRADVSGKPTTLNCARTVSGSSARR